MCLRYLMFGMMMVLFSHESHLTAEPFLVGLFKTFDGIFFARRISSLEQLAAHCVILRVDRLLKDPAEVQWEPTEGKDEDEAEDGFGHLPPLEEETAG